jgi:uncharacterized protein
MGFPGVMRLRASGPLPRRLAMRRLSQAACLIVATLALAESTQAESNHPQSNSISVTGDAEVRVVPDEVILTFGVETFDPVLKVAKDANDARIKRVIAVALSAGVPAGSTQTDYLSVEPRYRDGNVARDLLGYVVRRSVVVRLSQIARFEALLTDALDAGVTHVHGIEFRTTELRKHRDAARTLAIKAAREKAALLAGELGKTVGDVLTINEGSYGYFSSYGSYWGSRSGGMMQNVSQSLGGGAVGSDSALAPGQISIRAQVTASFGLR